MRQDEMNKREIEREFKADFESVVRRYDLMFAAICSFIFPVHLFFDLKVVGIPAFVPLRLLLFVPAVSYLLARYFKLSDRWQTFLAFLYKFGANLMAFGIMLIAIPIGHYQAGLQDVIVTIIVIMVFTVRGWEEFAVTTIIPFIFFSIYIGFFANSPLIEKAYLFNPVLFFIVAISYLMLQRRLRYQAFISRYQLKQVNEELKKRSQVKDEFISILTHDLKSPLTVVKGYSAMMLAGGGGEFNPQQKEIMEIIWKQASAQQGLIDSIMDYTRTQYGYTLNRERISFSALVSEMVEAEKIEADKKKIDLRLDLPVEEIYINADKGMMERVIGNLIGNAIKYTLAEGKISIVLKREEGRLRLSVADTGVGIKPEDINKVFDKFFSIGAVTQEKKGTGLGLFIAKNFIEAHGGRIWAESEGLGKGSTFTVVLPVA
jgi:signal transduction histidine kinase